MLKLNGIAARAGSAGRTGLLSVCLWVLSVAAMYPAPADPPCIEVDGRPFFVIGCYDYPGGDDLGFEHLKEMADSGINTVHWALRCFPEAYPNQPRDFTLEDLNNAHRLGLKVVAALNSVPPWTEADITKNWGSDPAMFREGSDLHKALLRIKDHPALLMYETMDEPLGCRVMDNRPTWPSLETLQECYRFVRSVDPRHPVWCNEVAWFWCKDRLSMEQFREWSRICDVYSQDDYPVGGPPYPYCPLFVIAEDLAAMMKIVDDGSGPAKPLMMVLQGQGRNMMASDRPEIHGRNPNRIETRYVAYSSIVHGAKGIWWWGTRDLVPLRDARGRLTSNGEFWEIIKLVSREISALKDFYVTARLPGAVAVSDGRLDAAMFRHGGASVLIVANRSDQTVTQARIRVLDGGWKAPGDGSVRVLFERRRVPAGEKEGALSWEDTFAPWDVHVYTDRPDICREW